ncbi:winged helix DNA-binding protein [Alteraurantiacibacter buctensis]|nr:winged helix DNA-binding protein [Alteraurantiacibacter buctensis]
MGQAQFLYDTAPDAAFGLAASIFADRDDVRIQMRDDAFDSGLVLRECASLHAVLADDPRPLGDVVLLDCPAPDGSGLAALARLDERAARSGAALVVSTTVGGLEDVFGCLSQSGAQILVNARRADRVIALGQALAGGRGHRVRELSDEDRLTLLRLTEQVHAISEKLERLSEEVDEAAVRSPATAFRFGDGAATAASPGDRLVRAARPALPDARLVRRIIHQRQLRARFFDGELFADPAWDMLLDLTAARVEHARVSVTSLCIASSVPPTTALRWISQLTEAGLFERVEDETDRRRAFIQLTDKACDGMARYFAELGKSAAALV